jgi:sugar (pentulose or hexulose) kinase
VRQSVDLVAELGLPVDRINVAGGGTASDEWRRIVAGVLGVEVYPTRVRDASALGAAAIAAVGLGAFATCAASARWWFDDPVTGARVRRAVRARPRDSPEARRLLSDLYRRQGARPETT